MKGCGKNDVDIKDIQEHRWATDNDIEILKILSLDAKFHIYQLF